MSAPSRGRGMPRPLYVAPPQRSGSAAESGHQSARTAVTVHNLPSKEITPVPTLPSPTPTFQTVQNLHAQECHFVPQHTGVSGLRVPKSEPQASGAHSLPSAETAALKHRSSSASSPVKQSFRPKSTVKASQSIPFNIHQSASSGSEFCVTTAGPSASAAPISTPMDESLRIISACMCISSEVTSNSDKALALKELEASIRSLSLSDLIPSSHCHLISSLVESLPPLVFSGSAGIRALALAVSDGLGNQKYPGWNANMFLLTCFRFLESSDSSNAQFVSQCLCFLITKCSRSWIEPSLSPCILQMLQFVDNLDSPHIFIQVTRIFAIAAKNYKTVFRVHLKGFLKMFLGWCLDVSIGLETSTQICHLITDFSSVLFFEPDLIQSAINKISVDLDRACILQSVDFRVPVLSQLLCKLHECSNGLITGADCLKRFTAVLSSLELCIEKCSTFGKSCICTSLFSLWISNGLSRSRMSARVLAYWFLCWEDESKEINEDHLSFIVNACCISDTIESSSSCYADFESGHSFLSFPLDSYHLSRYQRFFCSRSEWLPQCTHIGRVGHLMRTLLLNVANAVLSCPLQRPQFLDKVAQLANCSAEGSNIQLRLSSLQSLFFHTTSSSASPSTLLLYLLSNSPAYARISCMLLNNMMTAASATVSLTCSEINSSESDCFDIAHGSISLALLLRDCEMHPDFEIHQIVTDTLSLMVYTVASTCCCAPSSDASSAAVATISFLLQSVDEHVTSSTATEGLNAVDRRLLDDELLEAISLASISRNVASRLNMPRNAVKFYSNSTVRFFARHLDHSTALALLLFLEHPNFFCMSIACIDSMLLCLLQCCDGFGVVAAAAVSKHLLYIGIMHCCRMNSKVASHKDSGASRSALLRRIFAFVGNMSTIHGETCCNKIGFTSVSSPISLLSCMWTLSSFSFCDMLPKDIAVLFCDALMYASFSFDVKAITSIFSSSEHTSLEVFGEVQSSALSSDQIKTFMNYLSQCSSSKHCNEVVSKIPFFACSPSRNPSPFEISNDLSLLVRTIRILPFNAASAIVAGRFRGSWGGAKEFFDWLTSVSQSCGDQIIHNLHHQLVSSFVCSIQRLSCAACRPVFGPQGIPLDASNLYFSQNYKTIENHCHRVRSRILESPESLSPYDFHEHFKERLKVIVRSAAVSADKKSASAAITTSQYQIASRTSTTPSLNSLSTTELAMQDLEALVISAAHFCLRLMSPDLSYCLMSAARSSAARITGMSNSFGWTKVVSLMCLGSYEAAFDCSVQELQLSCSPSLKILLIECACTCITRLLNDSLFTKLESVLSEEEKSVTSDFALASSACLALTSWDSSFGVLQKLRVGHADSLVRSSAVSGFSVGLLSCISASVSDPSAAAKDISNLSVAISVSLASTPNFDFSVTESSMSDMALLNMIDSRQMPPNLGFFSHSNLWAITLGQSALISLGVDQKGSYMTSALKFVKSLRKNGCFSSAINFLSKTNLAIPSRPEFLIEHFRCIGAVNSSMIVTALTSLLSLASELRKSEPVLSIKAAFCASHTLLCCDRSILAECSKTFIQAPCSLLSESIQSSSIINNSQKLLLNSIAVSIADLNCSFDNPLPSSLSSTHILSKHLTKMWWLLGNAAFRITTSIFNSAGVGCVQEDEYLLKFISTQVPDVLKLNDREVMAAAMYAQNVWIEQMGNRFYHVLQPRSASEVDACLRLAAEKSSSGGVLSHASHDLIFFCWKKVFTHQQLLSSLATKSFLACLRCSVARESTMLDVVLKLLRIIGCYSAGLDHVLQDGLSTSPPTCWVRALPQLVAQLSHVSDRIAACAGSLLSNIAREFPNRVLYSAVCSVGLEDADSVTSNREWRVVLKELEKHQPHAVISIRRMSSELLLLSVLPEEKLLAAVAEVISQLPGKMQQYIKEVERASAVGNLNGDMQTQRYLTVFRPLLNSIETALHTFESDCSSQGSVLSPHQIWLNHNILPSFKSAVESACTPTNMSDVSGNWKPLRGVGQKVQELIRRRASIELSSVSSALSGDFFACNRLPMPPTTSDAYTDNDDVVISGIEPCIFVMRTKTLPKKIVFQSSVGNSKTFLLKGREDLNLDERMMQFVDVANLFFKETLPCHSRDCVKARKYCVTPLSKRAGLIEWIHHCSSLMHLYEAGVSSRAAVEVAAVTASSDQKLQSDARQSSQIKPVEYYNQQLQKALTDVGVNFKTVPRNQWPKEVMLKLYRQMAESAPRSIFHDALWSSSNSSFQWWTRHLTFSQSLAVSSMIGYVIGLGDRHLDNILLDLRDGSVLHIDWNVCFEKGLRLAIPETVPFRLTPGLQYALGPGGTEGIFCNVATQCIEVLRDNRDIFMTLLETFVHDPLLDWATALRTRRKRNALEICVNFSLLAARLDELLDAAQIKELPILETIKEGQLSTTLVADNRAFVGGMQLHLKMVHHDAQLKLSSAKYFVSAAATEVCMRHCRFSALKHLAGSYSARLAPEKSKASARSCRQDFMRMVIFEESKIAAFSDLLISLQQPSTRMLLESCLNMSRPLFTAHPPSTSSSWRAKKANDSSKLFTESEWNRLVATAHQTLANLDSAIKESRDFLLKYIDIVSNFSPLAYAGMTLSGEISRLGRAVVSEQDLLDGRSAIMAFSSFTSNTLLQTRKNVVNFIEKFHEKTVLASEQASLHLKSMEHASNHHQIVSMSTQEVSDVFESLREVIETHPFEALSTTVGFLNQSIISSCHFLPSLFNCFIDSRVDNCNLNWSFNCEWFCVVQNFYVPVVLTWLAMDSNSALAYLHNQSTMPLPYPCCTFCHGLQKNSLSEVISDDALCDAAFVVCKAWNIVCSSWLCLFSLSSQLAQQFSLHAVAIPEIEKVVATIRDLANSEVSHDTWSSFLRSQSEHAMGSSHMLQTLSAIYGWCAPLIDWFVGRQQPECLRSWMKCVVDVFSELFCHMEVDAFIFRISCIEHAFYNWTSKWIKSLFEDDVFTHLSSLTVSEQHIVDHQSRICNAIAADLNNRVNASYVTLYENRKSYVQNNLQQHQRLFNQYVWTHAPIIQLKNAPYCPEVMKDVEFNLPLALNHVQTCLSSFLSAHMNISSREDSAAYCHSAKQPEVLQRRAAVLIIKDNVTALLDLGKKIVELEQQRCHISLNWFGNCTIPVPSSVTQFLNTLASWEAASVFASGGLARVQEACDITFRALAVSEETANSAASDLIASEEAAARTEDISSALQRAKPILLSLSRLLDHPAADSLLPSDVASKLKHLISEMVDGDAQVEGLDQILKKLCCTQQAVSQAAASLNDKDEVDEVQPNHEGASLAVKALRRIQKKLSGRDMVDTGLSAKTQVERAIDSATNVNLLARMYEGWTPWI